MFASVLARFSSKSSSVGKNLGNSARICLTTAIASSGAPARRSVASGSRISDQARRALGWRAGSNSGSIAANDTVGPRRDRLGLADPRTMSDSGVGADAVRRRKGVSR